MADFVDCDCEEGVVGQEGAGRIAQRQRNAGPADMAQPIPDEIRLPCAVLGLQARLPPNDDICLRGVGAELEVAQAPIAE